MNWLSWIVVALVSFIAIIGLALVVLGFLTWWYNKTFCDDKE
jgi:hypothetical protein